MSRDFFCVLVGTFILSALGSTLQDVTQTLQAAQEETQSLLHQKAIPVDFSALRDADRNSEAAFFTYGNEFLNALSLGVTEFTVQNKKEGTEDLSGLNKYDAMKKSVLYDSRASYSLHSDSSAYVNFDDSRHASLIGSIHEYADGHIIQCGHTQNIPDGTFLIGSARGSWAMNSVIGEAVERSLSHLPPKHLAMRVEKGLTLLRKVISKESYQTGHSDSPVICSKLHTEDVHPLELFSKMKVESMSKNPFHQKYSERPSDIIPSSSQTSRKDLSNVLQPDFPWSCDSSAGGSVAPHGSGDSYSFQLGKTQGCMMYSADGGNYNFNYNPVSGTATTKSVDLQAGVTCVDCYAYLGSSLLVVVRYGYDSNTFDFEVKAGGDVGFSIDIEVQDPSISESKTVTILNAESTFTTVSLGQGLYLGHKFGGLKATLTGSGSAIGHASFSTKQSLNANVKLNYLPSSVTASLTKSGEYSSPIYTSGSFSSNNFNVAVALKGTEEFYLTFGGVLTFNFGTNVVGSISSLTETVTNAIASIPSSTNPDIVRSVENPTDYIAATTKSTSITVGFDIGLSSDSLVVKGAQVAMKPYTPSFSIIPYTTFAINTSPTSSPSETPTSSPSASPTFTPSTAVPTNLPSAEPTGPTMTPTSSPSKPTMAPTTSEPTHTPTVMPSEVPTAMPSAIPTGTPTVIPSAIPTGTPTVRPTPIPGEPTSSPTKKIVKSIRVDQKIGVSNATVAKSKVFKKAVKGSIAKLISIEESAINITKILFQQIGGSRTLLASSATVQYDIILVNSNMSVTGMQATLNDAITSGKMTSNIQSYSSSLAGVTAGETVTSVQDISPTSTPTSSPTESTSRKRLSTSQVVGIAIGVGTGVLFAGGVVCYYCFTGVGRPSQSFERTEGLA